MFHLPLGDHTVPMFIDILDRVFNGDNMAASVGIVVDLVDQVGKSRRLAASGLTGHQNQPLLQIGKIRHLRGIVHPGKIRQAKGEDTQGTGERAPLTIGIAAEPSDVGKRKGKVIIPHRKQCLLMPGAFLRS